MEVRRMKRAEGGGVWSAKGRKGTKTAKEGREARKRDDAFDYESR
jgi:hypothetical protein